MKKTYLIIGGVSIVLLLLAIWIYLLIYGTPKPVEQFFTDFSFSGTTENTTPIGVLPIETESQVDTNTAQLRQLTTRPIIGMGEYVDTTTEPEITFIRYAEAGTGHIYSINIATGEETRLSNTTIAGASRAEFSPNGTYVAMAAGYTNQPTITLLTLGVNTEATKTNILAQKMVDFTFSETNDLMYTEYSSSGQSGRVINPETLVGRNLFTVPFQSATVVWSTDPNTPNYVYPKTSGELPGYLYQIKNGIISRLNIAGTGLSAKVNTDYYVSTSHVSNNPLSSVVKMSSGERSPLPIIVEPSKCVFTKLETNIMYCGHEQGIFSHDFPDNWYKGLISFSDNIWQINLDKGSATQLVSPLSETGREIDVTNMTIGTNDGVLYFKNKNDNTLWMYEI